MGPEKLLTGHFEDGLGISLVISPPNHRTVWDHKDIVTRLVENSFDYFLHYGLHLY